MKIISHFDLLSSQGVWFDLIINDNNNNNNNAEDAVKREEADLLFTKLKRCYEVLIDPHKRAIYDCLGKEGLQVLNMRIKIVWLVVGSGWVGSGRVGLGWVCLFVGG